MNAVSAHWQAQLALQFQLRGARTVPRVQQRLGPLTTQRPFYPEDDLCHVYLLHPPGGIKGGDQLDVDIDVCRDARALLTTPAAAKVYRSARDVSHVRHTLSVHADASLEWLPQETILFGGSRLAAHTHVQLAPAARFWGWEMLCLGRPHSGDHYTSGWLDQRVSISIDGELRLFERQRWRDADDLFAARWGLAGYRVAATAYAYPADRTLLDAARRVGTSPECGAHDADVISAATLVDEILVVRVVASAAQHLRRSLHGLWSGLRPALLGRSACAPRIWAT